MFLIIGVIFTVIGYSLLFVNKTAKKTFNNVPPAKIVSAITNCPGKANVKKVDKKLWKISKPALFKKAPNANILDPSPKAGTPIACLTPFLKDIDENNF